MKKIIIIASALLLTGIFSGCASSAPITPQSVRESVGSGMFSTKKDSFVVNRPYNQVASQFQRNSKKCLNKSFTYTSTSHNGYYMQTTTNTIHYSGKFTKGRTLSTLEIKSKDPEWTSSAMTSAIYGDSVKDGLLVAMVDLHKKGNKTQVDIYRASMTFGANDKIIKAINSWAKTGSSSCPNIAP